MHQNRKQERTKAVLPQKSVFKAFKMQWKQLMHSHAKKALKQQFLARKHWSKGWSMIHHVS